MTLLTTAQRKAILDFKFESPYLQGVHKLRDRYPSKTGDLSELRNELTTASIKLSKALYKDAIIHSEQFKHLGLAFSGAAKKRELYKRHEYILEQETYIDIVKKYLSDDEDVNQVVCQMAKACGLSDEAIFQSINRDYRAHSPGESYLSAAMVRTGEDGPKELHVMHHAL